MGFQDGKIVLDSPNNAYYSGQTIHGRLIFEQDKQKTFRGIYARMRGYCNVHWTSDHTRKVDDRSESYTVEHSSHEKYIDHKVFLAGGKSGEHHLNPGKHEFPFSINVPYTCPSSFEGSYGHVRYELKVVVDRAFKIDKEISAPIKIIAPLDLNKEQYAKDPIALELNDVYCCWCVMSGTSETLVKLPVTGYCPGQVMPVEVNCVNKSNVDIEKIKITVKKEITFRAVCNPGTNMERDTVLEVKKGPVPANSTRSWALQLDVPAMDIYNLDSCSHIDVNYELKVTVCPEGCHEDNSESCLLIFGTIPLVDFQNNVQNPLYDQMPQPMVTEQVQNYPSPNTAYPTPVINQPLPTISPYPGATPYPGANSPYHSPNAPYLGSSSPYSGPNSPYPGPTPPYPGANLPYPGASTPNTSPYPAGNQSYPSNSPYPSQNQPYPSTNPYPGSTPPYPGSQYPNSNPYPNNTPYQGTPSQQSSAPYPTPGVSPVSNTLAQSGKYGFKTETEDGATIPLLPQGTSIPLPRSISPVPPASAPPVAAEDAHGQPTADADTESNPPYNPEFMKAKEETKKEDEKKI
ncbi:arrestin domain-containing protein 17-like [Galleria mellonella]|uniref:Arrestin domain-containing protein 17-like n=1 Tax=Galleria mellonella TaxID=7137 RepID=A0ABM3MLR2_GALME|nr:arrestin domain-containing protein 17-like [Galleria mellonella]